MSGYSSGLPPESLCDCLTAVILHEACVLVLTGKVTNICMQKRYDNGQDVPGEMANM